MNKKILNIFWGIVLIGLGGIFYLRETGVIDFNAIQGMTWAIIFGIAGAFFLLTYLVNGLEQWGWLFPAMVFLGVAATIGLEGTAAGRFLTGAPILAGLAVPFIVAFALKPSERWWALIPAWVMLILTGVIFFERYVHGNIIGTIVLMGIALPFLLVYLTDRDRKWALIPFVALFVISLIPLMEVLIPRRRFEIFLMPLFALPFIGTYIFSNKNWWAIIPAGVFLSIGLALTVETTRLGGELVTAFILGGFGLTFGVLWLLRKEHNTDWAKFPALGCFAVALLVTFFGSQSYYLGPILLIAAGTGMILYSAVKRNKESSDQIEK